MLLGEETDRLIRDAEEWWDERPPQSGTGPRGGPQNIHWPSGLEGEATSVHGADTGSLSACS